MPSFRIPGIPKASRHLGSCVRYRSDMPKSLQKAPWTTVSLLFLMYTHDIQTTYNDHCISHRIFTPPSVLLATAIFTESDALLPRANNLRSMEEGRSTEDVLHSVSDVRHSVLVSTLRWIWKLALLAFTTVFTFFIQNTMFRQRTIWDDPELSLKIREACRVAREAGYNLLWIDSCCIDKSSSSELSEAINSMYRWYRCAKVCFAYLADVP